MNAWQVRLSIGLFAVTLGNATAVNLSRDGAGQVMIFPAFFVDLQNRAEFVIRNTTARGKAVRVVVKDLILGRPTAAINVYLKANDSWIGRLVEHPSGSQFRTVEADLDWDDESCTFPARGDLPIQGLRLSDANLAALSFENVRFPLLSGLVEVYEMGTLSADLAADCEAIAERWRDGVWASAATRDDGLTSPLGGLRGFEVIKGSREGRSFQLEPLVLDGFRDMPLHTAPDSLQPNLSDVSPAQSVVFRTVPLGDRTIVVERKSNWTGYPVHAVDAVLMTERLETEYWSDKNTQAFASVLLTMPTRPYHTDSGGFYLGDNARQLAPFTASVPRLGGENIDADILSASTFSASGRPWDLRQPGGSSQCGRAQAVVNWVQLVNFITFSHACDVGEAEFILPNQHVRGRVGFDFAGILQSDEGDVYRGLPVYGHLMQDVIGGLAQRPVAVFARPMDRIQAPTLLK